MFAGLIGSAFAQPVLPADAGALKDEVVVLHSFCSQPKCADGSEPFANLTAVDGVLYGTTIDGGASGGGTLFVLR